MLVICFLSDEVSSFEAELLQYFETVYHLSLSQNYPNQSHDLIASPTFLNHEGNHMTQLIDSLVT